MNRQVFTPGRRRALAVGVALLVAALAGALFSMSRGGGNATAQRQGPQQQPSQQQGPGGADFQQFEQCLQSHGVTLTPGERPDFGDTTLRNALGACRAYLPALPGRGDGDDGPGFGRPDDLPSDGTT
jgi:hypothetical protein